MDRDSWKDQALRNIVRAYGKLSVRLANRLRLLAFPRRDLDQILRHLPDSGDVYDLGCGYGLFSIYFAMALPGIRMRGVDRRPSHVEAARSAVRRLALTGVEFEVGDPCVTLSGQGTEAVVMIDLVRHAPHHSAEALIGEVAKMLAPGGRLIIVDFEPEAGHPSRWTRLLHRLAGSAPPVAPWPRGTLHELLQEHGFQVESFALPSSRAMVVAEKAVGRD
jgi:SAM-dependent methyltransferase